MDSRALRQSLAVVVVGSVKIRTRTPERPHGRLALLLETQRPGRHARRDRASDPVSMAAGSLAMVLDYLP